MKYKVLLVKVKSNHQNLRTPTVSGIADTLPAVGFPFVMYGEPLTDEGDTRVVTTTPVTRILEQTVPGVTRFETENSTYELGWDVD